MCAARGPPPPYHLPLPAHRLVQRPPNRPSWPLKNPDPISFPLSQPFFRGREQPSDFALLFVGFGNVILASVIKHAPFAHASSRLSSTTACQITVQARPGCCCRCCCRRRPTASARPDTTNLQPKIPSSCYRRDRKLKMLLNQHTWRPTGAPARRRLPSPSPWGR